AGVAWRGAGVGVLIGGDHEGTDLHDGRGATGIRRAADEIGAVDVRVLSPAVLAEDGRGVAAGRRVAASLAAVGGSAIADQVDEVGIERKRTVGERVAVADQRDLARGGAHVDRRWAADDVRRRQRRADRTARGEGDQVVLAG